MFEKRNLIYCYTNKINGKRYIGQTTQKLKSRHAQHISDSKSLNKKRTYFHSAINKYGIENFDLVILEENKTLEELNELEKFYIAFYNTNDREFGYNTADGGENTNKFAGKTEEEISEWKRKLSEANKGEKNSMYGRHGANHPAYGRKHDEKTIEMLRKKFIGENNPAKRDDVKKKISQSMSGIKNHGCRKAVGINVETGETMFLDYIKQAKELYNYDPSKITKCCKYNHDKEEYLKTHKVRVTGVYKNHKWYYLEDYKVL